MFQPPRAKLTQLNEMNTIKMTYTTCHHSVVITMIRINKILMTHIAKYSVTQLIIGWRNIKYATDVHEYSTSYYDIV